MNDGKTDTGNPQLSSDRNGSHIRVLFPLFLVASMTAIGMYAPATQQQASPKPYSTAQIIHARKLADSVRPTLDVGSTCPSLSFQAVDGKPILVQQLKRPMVLVFLGAESVCTLKSLSKTWAQFKQADVVFVMQKTYNASVLKDCRSLAPNVEIVHDAHGEAAKTYYSWWTPRVYALDSTQHLAYIQPEETLSTQVPSEVTQYLTRP